MRRGVGPNAYADGVRSGRGPLVPADSFEMGKMINYGYGDMDGPTHTVTIERARSSWGCTR